MFELIPRSVGNGKVLCVFLTNLYIGITMVEKQKLIVLI